MTNSTEAVRSMSPFMAQSDTKEHDKATNSSTEESLSFGEEIEYDPELYRVDGSAYPSHTRAAIIILGVCLGNLVLALDNNIIATAIPQITTDFNSLDDVAWYGSAFFLTNTAFQPTYGVVYKYFQIKWAYLVTIVTFEAGSVVCATAKTSEALIIGRAIQGLGGAGILQGALAIVNYSFPISKRPLFIGVVTSIFGIASCFGPVLGGVFTDSYLGWRWCFWINLPVGAFTIASALFCFTSPTRKTETSLSVAQKVQHMDLPGAGLLISAMCCLFLALKWGGLEFSWSSARIIGLLVGCGLLLAAFVVLQVLLQSRATIPPNIFLQRSILGASLYSFFISCTIFVHTYYLPFYFQTVQGTSARASGIRSIPYAADISVGAVITGAFVVTTGWILPYMLIGAILAVIASGLLYTLDISSPAAYWVGYQVMAGLGSGFGIQLPFTIVQVVLKDDDRAIGNGIMVFFQQLGGALSIAIGQSVFTSGLRDYAPPRVDVTAVITSGATNISTQTAKDPSLLLAIVVTVARAIQRTFILPIVTAGLCVAMCGVMEWGKRTRFPVKKKENGENAIVNEEGGRLGSS